MTSHRIAQLLASANIQATKIERNPLTRGEWVVWANGNGYPVTTIRAVKELCARISPTPEVVPLSWAE